MHACISGHTPPNDREAPLIWGGVLDDLQAALLVGQLKYYHRDVAR